MPVRRRRARQTTPTNERQTGAANVDAAAHVVDLLRDRVHGLDGDDHGSSVPAPRQAGRGDDNDDRDRDRDRDRRSHAPTAPAETGFERSLTPQQAAALAELKTRLRRSAYSADVAANPDGDRFVLRFLRATMRDRTGERVFQVDDAERRLLHTLEFRREHQVDAIRRELEAGAAPPADYARYRTLVRPSLDYVDARTGRVVHVERFGALAQYVDQSAFTTEQWRSFFIRDCEWVLHALRRESKARGCEVAAQVTVMDMAHLGTACMRRLELFKLMGAVAATHWPELLGPVLMVNCPRVFTVLYGMVRGLVDEQTRAKLIIDSGVPNEHVAKHLSREQVPVEFGGLDAETKVGVCRDCPVGVRR